MEDWGQLWRDYGPWFVAVILILTNEKAQGLIRSIAGTVVPAWGERWKAKQEQVRYERERREHDRVDALLLAKETLSSYREEMQRERTENAADRAKTLEVVAQYERGMSAHIEVMRDQSDLLRRLVDRADRHDDSLATLAQKVDALYERHAVVVP